MYMYACMYVYIYIYIYIYMYTTYTMGHPGRHEAGDEPQDGRDEAAETSSLYRSCIIIRI